MNDKINAIMNCRLDDNLNFTAGGVIGNLTADGNTIQAGTICTGWGYWRDNYYPQVIRESYPVYLQERARDRGKEAFEIVKMLKDKRFINLEKVHDFIDIMDELIKIL